MQNNLLTRRVLQNCENNTILNRNNSTAVTGETKNFERKDCTNLAQLMQVMLQLTNAQASIAQQLTKMNARIKVNRLQHHRTYTHDFTVMKKNNTISRSSASLTTDQPWSPVVLIDHNPYACLMSNDPKASKTYLNLG
jgi:hypothetical protein